MCCIYCVSNLRAQIIFTKVLFVVFYISWFPILCAKLIVSYTIFYGNIWKTSLLLLRLFSLIETYSYLHYDFYKDACISNSTNKQVFFVINLSDSDENFLCGIRNPHLSLICSAHHLYIRRSLVIYKVQIAKMAWRK